MQDITMLSRYHSALETVLVGLAATFGLILVTLICSTEIASANGIDKIFVVETNNKTVAEEEEKGQSATGLERSGIPGKLIVKTIVDNNCQPRSFCDNIRDKDFFVKIFTFENNTLFEELDPIPGDRQGWTVTFYIPQSLDSQSPPYGNGVKYSVQNEVQNASKFERILVNTTYSQDCRGTIEFGTSPTCTVTNLLLGPR
jgi:hypothetical protein